MTMNLTLIIKRLLSVMLLTCAATFTVPALALPVVINLLLDASSSVSESDFRIANQTVAKFAEACYYRSQINPREPADWIAVNWFGGHNTKVEYVGTPFINCSDLSKMALLSRGLESLAHPKYQHTAIYDALATATDQVLRRDSMLPKDYLKVVVLVTDGEDNDSSPQAINRIRQHYPSDAVYLALVGVGSTARVEDLQRHAAQVTRIDNFGELLGALLVILQAVPSM
jgi:uncharacterized protein YegL